MRQQSIVLIIQCKHNFEAPLLSITVFFLSFRMTLITTVLKVLFVSPFWEKIIMILLDNKNDKNEVRNNLFSAGFKYWVKM
jgi:hypothetical protein